MPLDSCHNFICRSSQRATPTWITSGERKGGGGSQETRPRRGKQPLPATFIFILSGSKPFKREKLALFYKYFFSSLISSHESSRIHKRWRLRPGWPCLRRCFEVCGGSRCWQGDGKANKGENGRAEDLLAQTPLNSQWQPAQLNVPSPWKGI